MQTRRVRGTHVPPILCVGLAGAGSGLAVAVYLLSTEAVPHRERWAALALLTSWSFVGSGVLAWIRRPASRIGPLMVATGFALLTRPIWPTASTPAFFTATLATELVGYGLTSRERAVTQLVVGLSTSEIASRLHLALHGAGPLEGDLREGRGVHTRRAIARLFFDHYGPRAARVAPGSQTPPAAASRA
jgi:hypothetical protein